MPKEMEAPSDPCRRNFYDKYHYGICYRDKDGKLCHYTYSKYVEEDLPRLILMAKGNTRADQILFVCKIYEYFEPVKEEIKL